MRELASAFRCPFIRLMSRLQSVSSLSKWIPAVAGFCLLLCAAQLRAQPVHVHFQEGVTHGFLVMRDPHGKIIATGDMVQWAIRDKHYYSQLVFHFFDGSLYSDTTIFKEHGTFQLISDHLIEKGPSFKEQSEQWLDIPKREFKARTIDEHGKSKYVEKHKMKLPDDVMNGLIYLVIKNIEPTAKSTTVSMIVGSPTPRVVKLIITPRTEGTFLIGTSKRKQLHYVIHIDITGVAGVVAPIIGKQPPDEQMWIAAGEVPTFLKERGELYNGGPIWTIELAGPHWDEGVTADN